MFLFDYNGWNFRSQLKMTFRKFCCSLKLFFISLIIASQILAGDDTSPIPYSSNQVIIVVTDSASAVKGTLYYFKRDRAEDDWAAVSGSIPVVLGRSGLGTGIGLHREELNGRLPQKREGDGRSPAGVFTLSHVFGYANDTTVTDLKMPYIHITEVMECIDDINSRYYNRIVSRSEIEGSDSVDWRSSEKMRNAGIYYELGVVVDHNSDNIASGAGSCIFLHNWAEPDETMAGCTAMAPAKMREIVYWLDESKNPVLVQLTKELYGELMERWDLPVLHITNAP